MYQIQTKSKKAIVIGGGSAGIVSTFKLEAAGYDVKLCEKLLEVASDTIEKQLFRRGLGLHYISGKTAEEYLLGSIEFEKAFPGYHLPTKGSDYYFMVDSQFTYHQFITAQSHVLKKYEEQINKNSENKVFGELGEIVEAVNGIDERFSNEDGRGLFLLSEFNEKNSEYNNLYLFTTEENEQTVLCYKYKTEQGEVREMKLADNQIEKECLSRIIKAVTENKLNTIKDEDRIKFFKFSTTQGHTHPSCAIKVRYKTQETVLDWPKFRQDLINKLKNNQNIKTHTNIEVIAIEFNYLDEKGKYDYNRPLYKVRYKNVGTNEEFSEETDHIVNAAWYNIQHLNQTLFKTLDYKNEEKFCKRLKFSLHIKLCEELKNLPTSFFCFGAFFAITNLEDGTALLIYERVNTLQSNDEVLPKEMQKFLDGTASEEEKEVVIESILKGANRYLKKVQGEDAIKREHVIKLKAGIVMTDGGSVNMDDPNSPHHSRSNCGVERATVKRKEWLKRPGSDVVGIVNNAGMKFMYCVSNGEKTRIKVEEDRIIIEKFRSVQAVWEKEGYKKPYVTLESKSNEEKIEQNNPEKEKKDKIKHIFEWQSVCFSRIMLHAELLKNEVKLKQIKKNTLKNPLLSNKFSFFVQKKSIDNLEDNLKYITNKKNQENKLKNESKNNSDVESDTEKSEITDSGADESIIETNNLRPNKRRRNSESNKSSLSSSTNSNNVNSCASVFFNPISPGSSEKMETDNFCFGRKSGSWEDIFPKPKENISNVSYHFNKLMCNYHSNKTQRHPVNISTQEEQKKQEEQAKKEKQVTDIIFDGKKSSDNISLFN